MTRQRKTETEPNSTQDETRIFLECERVWSLCAPHAYAVQAVTDDPCSCATWLDVHAMRTMHGDTQDVSWVPHNVWLVSWTSIAKGMRNNVCGFVCDAEALCGHDWDIWWRFHAPCGIDPVVHAWAHRHWENIPLSTGRTTTMLANLASTDGLSPST